MKLTLKREALAALTAAELGTVAGGAAPTMPVADCLSAVQTFAAGCVSGHTCIDCLTRWC